jgi:hypothetical protein
MVAEQLSSLVIRASNQPKKIQKNKDANCKRKDEETASNTKRRKYFF